VQFLSVSGSLRKVAKNHMTHKSTVTPRRHGHGHRDGSDGGKMKLLEGKGEDGICVGKKVREDKAQRGRGKRGPPCWCTNYWTTSMRAVH
jgi:hypothetical protein